MIANYHTHTTRCRHASGTEREYVERAIESGLKILGFADHTPNPYPEGFAWRDRMLLEEMDDYVKTVLALRDEYKNDIEIHLGLEVEYYENHFQGLMEFVKDYPVEYFLLAQHSLEDRHGYRTEEEEADPRLLERYCEIVIEGMRTGRFSYVAHPDAFKYRGDPAMYDAPIRRLCRCASDLGIPLEINFGGLRKNGYYPAERFWKIAREEDCTAVFGVDAHAPGDIGQPQVLERAEELVRRHGLRLAETVELKSPFGAAGREAAAVGEKGDKLYGSHD